MEPVSIPIDPAIPAASFYPLSSLYLLPVYHTREEYEAAYGVQAPPWDPSRPRKHWMDTSASGTTYEYTSYVLVPNLREVETRTFTLSSREASAVNLPGAYRFDPMPPPPPTSAELISPGGGHTQPLSPYLLIEEADATLLVQELGRELPVEGHHWNLRERKIDDSVTITWGAETRRIWEIVLQPNDHTQPQGASVAAQLWKDRHQRGLLPSLGTLPKTAPGHWELHGNHPDWTVDIPGNLGFSDRRDAVPVPCRPLLTDERIEVSGFTNAITVYRGQPDDQAQQPSPAIESRLADIEAKLDRIGQALLPGDWD